MQGGRWKRLLLTGVLLALLPAERAAAVNPETLLMPGKLSAAHQKYEENCSQCHDRTDRQRQTALCLDCHKEVRADLQRHGGFHGRLPNMEGSQCSACHTEHQG